LRRNKTYCSEAPIYNTLQLFEIFHRPLRL
jgi:hypothetical protein